MHIFSVQDAIAEVEDATLRVHMFFVCDLNNQVLSPKSGNVTNIVWNVADKSLSTLFKKSAMRVRFGQSIVQNVVHNLAMKVMYSAMVYMYNAIKVIDNAMINITYA